MMGNYHADHVMNRKRFMRDSTFPFLRDISGKRIVRHFQRWIGLGVFHNVPHDIETGAVFGIVVHNRRCIPLEREGKTCSKVIMERYGTLVRNMGAYDPAFPFRRHFEFNAEECSIILLQVYPRCWKMLF